MFEWMLHRSEYKERNPDGLTRDEFIGKYPEYRDVAALCWFLGVYPEDFREQIIRLLKEHESGTDAVQDPPPEREGAGQPHQIARCRDCKLRHDGCPVSEWKDSHTEQDLFHDGEERNDGQ